MSITKNNNFLHDLAFGNQSENELIKVLSNSTLELKTDRFKNGRHAIELKKVVKGEVKPSGLSATKAEYYALAKSNSYILIATDDLKKIVQQIYDECVESGRGGFNKTSGLFLLAGKFIMAGDGWRSYCLLLEESELLSRLEALRNA